MTATTFEWEPFQKRIEQREWRACVFRDMILQDLKHWPAPRVLDIGCGSGFDDDLKIQQQLAAASGRYVGIEPDAAVPLGDHFHEVHRCLLEDAPLPNGSIDLAFAVMVLEHVAQPRLFFQKVYDLLAPGGVFWGFTMNARHYFRWVSLWTERLHLKDAYLNLLRGQRGVERYANYPTHYRANSPRQVARDASTFAQVQTASLGCVGQLDYYVPRLLRGLFHLTDHAMLAVGLPGSLLAIRLAKESA